jgi:hypothetical protein
VSRWPESLYYVTYRYTAPLCPRAHQPEGHAPERHRPVAAFKRLTLHMATTAWLFNPIIATHEPNQSRSSSYISRTAGYLGPSPTVEVRCCSKRSIVHSDYSPSNDLKPMTHRCLFHRIARLVWRLQHTKSRNGGCGKGFDPVLHLAILTATLRPLV